MFDGRQPIFYWHIHHDVLVEELDGSLADRIRFIKAYKPQYQVETRIRLMKPAHGIVELVEEHTSAVAAIRRKYSAYTTSTRLNRQLAIEYNRFKGKLDRMHAEQCADCSWNGKTIFPKHEIKSEVKDGRETKYWF